MRSIKRVSVTQIALVAIFLSTQLAAQTNAELEKRFSQALRVMYAGSVKDYRKLSYDERADIPIMWMLEAGHTVMDGNNAGQRNRATGDALDKCLMDTKRFSDATRVLAALDVCILHARR
jgi:hypothetical protein